MRQVTSDCEVRYSDGDESDFFGDFQTLPVFFQILFENADETCNRLC